MATFLERMNERLKQICPGGEGTAFSLTDGNDLPNGWLAQTPNIWGKEVTDVQEGENGKVVVKHIRDLIAGATNRIDVTTLAQFPDGDFLGGIQQGLMDLAQQDKGEVKVRILAGYPVAYLAKQSTYLEKLVEPLKRLTKGRLRIYVAAQRTGPTNVTWNHAKIVAVDGERALVGGQNLWTVNPLPRLTLFPLAILTPCYSSPLPRAQ